MLAVYSYSKVHTLCYVQRTAISHGAKLLQIARQLNGTSSGDAGGPLDVYGWLSQVSHQPNMYSSCRTVKMHFELRPALTPLFIVISAEFYKCNTAVW